MKASAISNVMIGAIINGNLDLAGELMGRDLFHEHYREKWQKIYPPATSKQKHNQA